MLQPIETMPPTQGLPSSEPVRLNYKNLVRAIERSIALENDLATADSSSGITDEAILAHRAEIGLGFDEAISRCLAAIAILHHNIIIEVNETDGLGPNHVFPWLKMAQTALKNIGGDRNLTLEIPTPQSIPVTQVEITEEPLVALSA